VTGRSIYLTDAYLQRFDTVVVQSTPDGVILEETAFYPEGGGQPADAGTLTDPEGHRWTVSGVFKDPAGVMHRLAEAPSLSSGRSVHGAIDWERRYAHMRYHTALHILSGATFHRFAAGITGGQIYPNRARMDFTIPDFSRSIAESLIDEVNDVVRRDLPIHVRFLSRDQAEADPNLVRVARELLPDVAEIRVIDIEGYDVQADGGTHVRSTREVGNARLERIENKGARNKRMTLILDPPDAPSVDHTKG